MTKRLTGGTMALAQEMTTDAELVDGEALAELRLLFGERAAALLATTRGLLIARLADVGPAAEVAAWGSVARLAHEIAGMAAQVGLVALAREAAALERRCARPDGVTADAVDAFAALARRSLAALPTG